MSIVNFLPILFADNANSKQPKPIPISSSAVILDSSTASSFIGDVPFLFLYKEKAGDVHPKNRPLAIEQSVAII